MTINEQAQAVENLDAVLLRRGLGEEPAMAAGRWQVHCLDRSGKLKWADSIENVVCTEGKNVMMDAAFGGAGSTAYVGLVSSVSYTAVAATDTAAQINGTNGWKEAGGANAPTYTGNRQTAAWAAASANSKAFSASASFNVSGAGTVKGMFLVYGSGASPTKDSATGFLWSAGLFSQGDKIVGNGDTLNASYSTSL